MKGRDSSRGARLNLRAGEWVEVRSQEEILATLDQDGRLEALPFMPEMLQYCGRKFRVFKRADKTCDNIQTWSMRRLEGTVHLEGLRCDGTGHDECEAGCLIFWKEAWLRRAANDLISPASLPPVTSASSGECRRLGTVENILAASQTVNSEGESVFSCQATELRNFTSFMRWWDPRQYIRDIRSGNVSSSLADGSLTGQILEVLLDILQVTRAMILSIFRDRRGVHYPYISGMLEKTPTEKLDLQPGELVQVRSKEEIVATLDKANRNRGLLFDGEMLRYCGGIYRVLRRVDHMIDEKTGKMMNIKYPCIVLEGVVCQSDYHRLCPRAIYHYWRENWLRRALDLGPSVPAELMTEACEKC